MRKWLILLAIALFVNILHAQADACALRRDAAAPAVIICASD